MLVEGLHSTRAAFEVGYERTAQFTREYKRLFGEPPTRDVKSRREKPAHSKSWGKRSTAATARSSNLSNPSSWILRIASCDR